MKYFPFFFQSNPLDCGPTCLKMIAVFFGKKFDPAGIQHMSKVNHHGSSMLDLMVAAGKLQLHCEGLEVNVLQLAKLPLPAILHWEQQHFVVLFKIKKQVYYIADPAIGKIKLYQDDLIRHWQNAESKNPDTGFILTFSLK